MRKIMLRRELPVVGKRAGRHGSDDTEALGTGLCTELELRQSTIERMTWALFTITITPAQAAVDGNFHG